MVELIGEEKIAENNDVDVDTLREDGAFVQSVIEE